MSEEGPRQLAEDVYFVGRREGVLLERNIYLRLFKGNGKQTNFLIEPGPPSDLDALAVNASKLIGHLKKVNLIFGSHQDPDVIMNAAYVQKLNPQAVLLMGEDTLRLVKFYGLNSEKFTPIEKFKSRRVRLSTGHVIAFVPAPFCHFRGAYMVYDETSRVLFTGDLLGGLSYTPEFMAVKQSWEGIKLFHQIYMPSKSALHYAVTQIRALDPKPVMIAPQHGSIIGEDLIDDFLERLDNLEVGLDLILDADRQENYVAAINEIIAELRGKIGDAEVSKALQLLKADQSLTSFVVFSDNFLKEIKVDPISVLRLFGAILKKIAGGEDKMSLIEMTLLKVLMAHNIPTAGLFEGEGDAAEFAEE